MDVKIIIALLLTILPILSFSLQYYFSKKDNCLKALRNHGAVFYSDWLFVIFNLLFIYSVSLPTFSKFILVFVFSILANIVMHAYWSKMPIEKEGSHMYHIKTRKLLRAGIVHFCFSIIQLALIILFLLSPIKNSLYFYESIVLGLFFLSFIPSSLKIHHGKLLITDLIACILGILTILVKILI